MDSTDFPSADLVIPDLGEFLRVAGEALDAGTAVARQHYELRKRVEVEAALASMIARSVTKERLKSYGLETDDLETQDIPLIGIRVVVRGANRKYCVAIWKSTDDEMPVPGYSRKRRFFLARNQLAFDLDAEWAKDEINLALIWNASRLFYLTDLFLHMPRGAAENFFKSPESYWSERIPLPAELIEQKEAGPTEGELPYEKIDDSDPEAE